METHLNLSVRAPIRLEYLRKLSTSKKWVRPMTWRDCRFANFKTPRGLSCGSKDGAPVWYSHNSDNFPREKRADEIRDFRHTGYFTDTDCSELAWGIVACLPHGRFIAGYHWDSNGESVYFPEIFTNEKDAATRADSHAEWFADQSREDSEKYDMARQLDSEIEEKTKRRTECLLLARIYHARENMRDEARELREEIREARETLKSEYSDYV